MQSCVLTFSRLYLLFIFVSVISFFFFVCFESYFIRKKYARNNKKKTYILNKQFFYNLKFTTRKKNSETRKYLHSLIILQFFVRFNFRRIILSIYMYTLKMCKLVTFTKVYG